jgi:L-fucose mutarotase
VKKSGNQVTLEAILKWDFYKQVESPDHVLTIQTGDQALWGNVLLTLGCRTA